MGQRREVEEKRVVDGYVLERLSCGHWLDATKLQPLKPERNCPQCPSLKRPKSQLLAEFRRKAKKKQVKR